MKNNRKKAVIVLVMISTLASSLIGAGARYNNRKYKNVIVLVPDGCNQNIQTAARWYKGEPLTLDGMESGSVSTYMSNSLITGSAAAGTAFATGHKTTVRFLGIGPRTDDLLPMVTPTAEPYSPVASVMEAVKLNRKSVGLVATSRITHATPAAYASHVDDRGKDNEIMENMVYQDIDVVLGGGFRHLIPSYDTYTTSFGASWSGKRTDNRNLYNELIQRGYTIVDSKEGMNAVTRGPVWGLFDDSHMDAEMDREQFHPSQPSLSEMTEKAIEILSKDPHGFFLMVEGSQIDWAGHNNDPIYMITDFLEFDDAVKVAVDYAARDKQTLVLVFPDHNTGGMTMGNYGEGAGYTSINYDDFMDPLEGMTMTSGALSYMIDDVSVSGIKNAVGTYWGLDITDESAQKIIDLTEEDVSLNYALAHVISEDYTVFGWTTFGHNGGDVPLWSYTYSGHNRPIGHYDNTELAHLVADALGASLEDTQDDLFIKLSDVLESDQWSVDTSNPEDPIINIELQEGVASINAGSDVVTRSTGYYTHLSGIVVYAPMTGEVYIPEDCCNYLNAIGIAE
ncbi:alkaline phosphatase [Candidatus Bathyarchaeota archaeon]|nr:alkaline phosphatase [Candidatus Bathyarchaeota archaeon]